MTNMGQKEVDSLSRPQCQWTMLLTLLQTITIFQSFFPLYLSLKSAVIRLLNPYPSTPGDPQWWLQAIHSTSPATFIKITRIKHGSSEEAILKI